jgi:signal transduction histidine kinase
MSEKEFNSLIETKGLHGLAIVLPTDSLQNARIQDLWLRIIISGFGAIAVIGFGFAWRALLKSSEYQMRLVRASELNSHLREMNVAAAGLAHETRNPLNIIRGLAQIVSRIPDVDAEIRKKSIEITEEVDRVTVQLNEFINYSKPREVRRAPVPVGVVMADVVRALNSDLEDKAITLEISDENLIINADQQLLRQALFNLVMNAIQAVAKNGKIQIVGRKIDAGEGCVEVRDDGPGIAASQTKEIFKPYFTTRDNGTGLGLAVVKQIVLAHGWEIECLPNNNKGAVFRVSRLELVSASRP